MSSFTYETNKGSFTIDSNRPLNPEELAEQIKIQEAKDMSIGEIISSNFVKAAKGTFQEGVVPIAKGLDVAAFGLPRTMLKAFNPELDKQMFPDQETLGGKVFNIASQVRGLLKGGAVKAGEAVGAKLIPKAATLGQKIKKGATIAGVGGATQFVGDPEKTLLDQIGKQGIQGALSAGIGAGVPVAGAGIAKGKELGQTFSKGAKGFVSDALVPKMMEKFGNSVSKLGSKFTKFAEEKLNIPKQSLEVIKNKGEAVLDEVFAATRGATDDIANRLQRGLGTMRTIADDAYTQAMDSVPNNHLFSINKTYNKLRGHLRENKLIDLQGNLTQRGQEARAVNKRLINIYDDMNRGVVGEGRTIATGKVQKNDFNFYRDELSDLYSQSPKDRIIFDTIDSLYDDAAESGFQGLKEGRALQKRAFQMEKKFANSALTKEQKLNRYHKWTSEEKRDLKELTGYIEDTFPTDAGIIDDLESTVSSADLQVMRNKIGPEVMRKDLKSAIDKENFNTIKSKWASILDDPVDDIFNEIKQVRTGRAIRRFAEKAAVPAVLATGVASGIGYGMYRLGAEGVQDLFGDF